MFDFDLKTHSRRLAITLLATNITKLFLLEFPTDEYILFTMFEELFFNPVAMW